ncbi:hypothetical protein ACN268_21405 [Micromonospora sp. WMMD735]|uniref:hypothetical protein n=1 Tax=Micromonospora sp. WMMD735 TaxID=3404130 RepID=UPI003B929EA3
MTAPHLSLAQIRNRLVLTARAILRAHRTDPDGRCRVCRVADCRVSAAARDVIHTAAAFRTAEEQAADEIRAFDDGGQDPRPAGVAPATEAELKAVDDNAQAPSPTSQHGRQARPAWP